MAGDLAKVDEEVQTRSEKRLARRIKGINNSCNAICVD
jgi:hypothetical protein